MKNIICTLFGLLICAAPLLVQTQTPEKKHKIEIGFNANSLIQTLTKINVFKNGFPERVFLIKFYNKKKTIWRLGAGYHANADVNENGSVRGIYKAAASFGFERRKSFHKRWVGYWGLNGGFRIDQRDNPWKRPELNLGPLLGVYLMINENFALATEASFYVHTTDFPDSWAVGTRYFSPTTLYVAVRF